MGIKYPNWRHTTSPTPNNFLVCCDKCERAIWTIETKGNVYHCGCGTRQREATPIEYVTAKDLLVRYLVEGLRYTTYSLANIVAKRLYKRYNRCRTIEIIRDDDGKYTVVQRLVGDAIEIRDTQTIDIFGD